MRVSTVGTDQHIVKAVAVDVAGGADGTPALITDGNAIQAKAITAIEGVEHLCGTEAASLAE